MIGDVRMWSCPCKPDDPMAVLVSRCNHPIGPLGPVYVVYCQWCGDGAPFVFLGFDNEDLNRDALAAWEGRHRESDYTDLLARYEAVVGSRETGPNVIPECLSHPDAPHGYDRTSSHSLGRYMCDCEGWTPDEDDRAMQDNGGG